MHESLEILALNYEYPPLGGGGGVLARHVLERLAELGHRPTVITSGFGDLKPIEHSNGVEIHRLPVFGRGKRNTASLFSMLSYDPLTRRAGVKLGRARQFDVALSFFAIPTGPAGHYVSRRLDIPNVLFLLGGDVYDPTKRLSPHKTPLLKRTVGRVISNADHVFAGSSDIRASALKYFNVDRDVEMVPLCIKPYDIPDNVDRQDLGLGKDDIVIVTVGRVVRRKNIDALIDAVDKLNQSPEITSRLRLIVVGDGPERLRLEEMVASRGSSDTITFAGNIDDDLKHRYLASADIYASTSVHEGFGLVFLEGMHAGLPVICYNNGGQVDFVKNDINGFVVQLNDTESFAKRLAELVSNPEMRDHMRQRNLEDVKPYYVSSTCERYLEVMSELVDQKKHA